LATSWFFAPSTGICGSPRCGGWLTESESLLSTVALRLGANLWVLVILGLGGERKAHLAGLFARAASGEERLREVARAPPTQPVFIAELQLGCVKQVLKLI
jgi:hypothetical protein